MIKTLKIQTFNILSRRFLIIILLFSYVLNDDTLSNYLWPTNTSKSITTLFGEKRSRRFHAGIDVRTYGKIGDKIYAIESGYISRIKISPDGYGKALYLTLNDSNVALYAHLDKYNLEIESIIKKIREKNNNSFIDKYFTKDYIKVEKGDILGYCGDTGSLSGPHLHFEIRDNNGSPINPLINHYTLPDTVRPIAEAIAIIPLNKNCYINGTQKYNIFDIEPLSYNNNPNIYKYFINDTISVIGEFGIGLEVYDKINNSPFNFGIYEIEVLIDNNIVYKINFDQYNFKDDHLIYKEIDYYLMSKESRSFHRLFLNNNNHLDFIDKKSNKGITLDSGYHNLIINVKDNFNNSIQIQGILKGDINLPPNFLYNSKNHSLNTLINNKHLLFELTTRYKNSRKINPNYQQLDSISYQFEKPLSPYEVLELKNKKNGIVSKSKFISLIDFDPYKINGEFELEHLDNHLIINFIESEFSGFEAKLILKGDNNNEIKLKRSSKNILSSGLIDIELIKNLNEISISYESNPEIVFSKKIHGKLFSKNDTTSLDFKNYQLISNKNSLYSDSFLWIEEESTKIPKEFTEISNPIKISPNNIPFKDYIILNYNNYKINSGGIYKYNKKNDKWIFQGKINDSGNTEIKLYSGGIFCIMDENINPIIKNIFPNNNSYYNINDVKMISFNLIDVESNIDYNSINIVLNNKPIYFDYIPYRDYVRATIFDPLENDKNILEIFTNDNIGNKSYKKINFYIK